jgi:hypothetical protein
VSKQFDAEERFESPALIFAFSWRKVVRRAGFLTLIEARYAAASAAYILHSQRQMKELEKLGTGPAPIPLHLAVLIEEGEALSAKVHVEIESYHLFAKIVLDDIARAIDYYFGPQRRLALDSHDDLTRHIRTYAVSRRLTLTDEFVAAIEELKLRICDFRDQNIAHEKSPRTLQGTTWSPDGGARISGNRLTQLRKSVRTPP